MKSSPRHKHSFSSGPAISSSKTRTVYARGSAFGRGYDGRRRLSGYRLRVVISAVIGVFILIGAAFGSHNTHSTYKVPSTAQIDRQLGLGTNPSLTQIERSAGQLQAQLPTVDGVIASDDVMMALINHGKYITGEPTCPSSIPNVAGHRFTCTVQLNGHGYDVQATISANKQTVDVGAMSRIG